MVNETRKSKTVPKTELGKLLLHLREEALSEGMKLLSSDEINEMVGYIRGKMNGISKTKQYEITSICYANVVGMFLTFLNPQNRGDNFKWDDFVDICDEWSELWIAQNDIRGCKASIKEFASQTTREIGQSIILKSKRNNII